MKNKNHKIISIEVEKASDKIQHPFFDKNPPESEHKRKLPQNNKGHIWPSANIILNGEKLTALPLRSGIRQGCPLSPLLFNRV